MPLLPPARHPGAVHRQHGIAALLTMIIVVSVMLAVSLGAILVSYTNQRVTRTSVRSSQSYYVAEAGLEDSLLRIINPEMTYRASHTLTVGGHTAVTNITQAGSDLTVESEGTAGSVVRTVATTLRENTTGASFFYGVQVDEGGLEMGNNAQVLGNVYSNGDIAGNNGAVITGDATVAGGLDDAPQVEWTAQTADQFFATASTNRDIAQSFIATETGPLPRVSVYLGKVGTPSSSLTLHITNDNNGKPATSSLANATIAASAVGTTPGWIDTSFTSPAPVTDGSKYWIVLDYNSNSTSNHWNWRKDPTGGYPNNTGSYTSNWSSGSAVWTSVEGDLAFRAWIGGTSTAIRDMTIGDATSGTGRANAFVNTTIHGSACPNQYCLIENPPRVELPLAEALIQGWKDDAALGGTHVGNYTLDNSASASLGPIIITGDLVLSNSAILTVTGTIWVEGDIQLSNGCQVQLDSGYGTHSGILGTDGVVQISNNCEFLGSGSNGSYIMLLSENDAPADNVMAISNNSVGVVYYARRGRLHFSNNAEAKEATAYGISLDNGATITYESGLQNMTFSAGPAGGWDITSWKEVE